MSRIPKRRRSLRILKNYLLITAGCLLLAFGDAAFLEPLGLVNGGIISIGIILQKGVADPFWGGTPIVDYVTWGAQLILLGVSFLCLGKKFTLHTMYATLIYPLFFMLLYRVPVATSTLNGELVSLGKFIGEQLELQIVGNVAGGQVEMVTDYSLRILAGLAGGACVGIGVGVTYLGDGSTGGLDVVSVIIARHTPVKESVSAFVIDAILIFVGLIWLHNLPNALIGILSAFICALGVQYVYVNVNGYVIADIVSEHPDEIMNYVHQEMDHGSTLIEITGGYSGAKKQMLRVAFNRRELYDFKYFLAKVDPTAFVTFTQASMINGEGFDPLLSARMKAEMRIEESSQKKAAEKTKRGKHE